MPRGAIGRGIVTKRVTENYVVEEKIDQVLADASGGAIEVTLVPRNSHVERIVAVQQTDGSGNAVTVVSAGSSTINGAPSYAITGGGAIFEQDDLSNWHAFQGYGLGGQITDNPVTTGHSYQTLPIDTNLPSNAGSDTSSKYLAAAMFNIIGAALTKLQTYIGAVIGKFSITGTNPSSYPWGAGIFEVGDGTTEASGAVVAVVGGDSAQTKAGAALSVDYQNSTAGSGFNYIVDGYHAAHDGYLAATPLLGFARLGVDSGGTKNVVIRVAAFTDNDATALGDGSLIIDPTTGSGKLGVVINGFIQTVTT